MNTKVILSSDSNYDDLVAEIYIDDKYVALVGFKEDNFFVETPSHHLKEDVILRKIPYDIFIELLNIAKEKLNK